MTLSALPRLHKFLAARFSPEGELGLHLTAGVLLMLGAAWIFGSIAEDVFEAGRITALDLAVARWFHAHATPGVTQFMLLISAWHSTLGVLLMALLLAAFFYAKRARYWLLAVVTVVPGGMILNVLLKYTFHRARPSFEHPLLTLPTYSFPSGHAAGATLLYGVLACYLVCVIRSWRARAAIVAAACAMVALVGLSRIYLGVHYLSDVMAAIAEGCAWLAVCITALSTLRRRRAARPDR
jgi:membrane-associated phospholipid phosphatase